MTIDAFGAGEQAPAASSPMHHAPCIIDFMANTRWKEGSGLRKAPERLELVEHRLAGGCGGVARPQLAHIQQDLHHELIPPGGVVELLPPPRPLGGLGGV